MGTFDNERIRACEEQIDMLKEAKADMETRMRAIEQTIWKAFGAMVFVNFLVGIALVFIKK